MKNSLYVILVLFSISLHAFSKIVDLPIQEVEELKKGKILKKVEELKGEMWPQVTVLTLLPKTPKENVEIFTNFEDHQNFIPDVTKSQIVKKVSENETWVKYKMKMPWPVEDSQYTTTNKVEKIDETNFRVTWDLIEANQMKATKGTVLFEAFEDGTLMSYTSHITPNTSLAKMFTSRVDDDVEKTVKIIRDHHKKKLLK